ncbi:MAG TPA: hypothetical protein VGP72_05255 [Planctomycetota bacterium]
MTTEQTRTLEQEQADFEAALPELLKSHGEEFVVFKDSRAHAFYRDFDSAYAFALKTFGVDAVFLIARVERPEPLCTSLSWTAGAMFTNMK